jgi:putative PIN family toxin of toxin-antitoxin system
MSESASRVVFDCNIFAQALITPHGNAGRCIQKVLEEKLRLFWSEYVLSEIRRIPEKKTPQRLGVTAAMVETLIERLTPRTQLIDHPPSLYVHPVDPKDSQYIDLALAADATLIVSRDKHLLHLTDPSNPSAREFIERFPHLTILQPEKLLELIRNR